MNQHLVALGIKLIALLEANDEKVVQGAERFDRCFEKQEEQRVRELEKKRDKPFAKFAPGINYSTIAGHDFWNAWGNLPE